VISSDALHRSSEQGFYESLPPPGPSTAIAAQIAPCIGPLRFSRPTGKGAKTVLSVWSKVFSTLCSCRPKGKAQLHRLMPMQFTPQFQEKPREPVPYAQGAMDPDMAAAA